MFTVHLENLTLYEQTSQIIKQSKLNVTSTKIVLTVKYM